MSDSTHNFRPKHLQRAYDQTLDNGERPAASPRVGGFHHVDAPAGYELLGEIGRGGMGVVYRARDSAFGRDVAVKILRPDCPATDPLAERFFAEARVTGQLQHPGIPPVFEMGTLPDGRPFLAMKLIKGQTLGELIDNGPDRRRLLGAFEHLCHAVGYAHSRGVIHRDLKPSNIMVGAFGEVQVMDWGLAKVLATPGDESRTSGETDLQQTDIRPRRADGTETTAGTVLGTPAYMAPEQAGGEVEKVDRRSDVFALGGIVCSVLTGLPPYTGADTQEVYLKAIRGHLADAFAALDGCGADPEWVALAKRCLATDPADRPADAGEVARAVGDLRADAEARARRAALERAAARAQAVEQRKRRKVQLSLVAVLGLLASSAAAFAWWEERAAERGRAEDARRRSHAERETTAALAEFSILRGRGVRDMDDPARWRLTLAAARSAFGRAAAAANAGPVSDELRASLAAAAERLESDEADCGTAELCESWYFDFLRAANGKEMDRGVFETRPRDLFARIGVDLPTASPDAVVAALERSRQRYRLTPILFWSYLGNNDARKALEPVLQSVRASVHPLARAARNADRAGTLESFLTAGEGRALGSEELVTLLMSGEFGGERWRDDKPLVDEAIRRNPASVAAVFHRATSALGADANQTFEFVGAPGGQPVRRIPLPAVPSRDQKLPPLEPRQFDDVVVLANALALRPDSQRMFGFAAEACARYQLHAKAAEYYRRSIQLGSDWSHDYYGLAESLFRAGRFRDAVPAYREAFGRFPKVPPVHPDAVRNAARCAILLAHHEREGAGLTAEERRELRLSALGWLRQWARPELSPKEVFLLRWDPALRFVRDPEHLDQLRPDEAGRWVAFWDDLQPRAEAASRSFAVLNEPNSPAMPAAVFPDVAPTPRPMP